MPGIKLSELISGTRPFTAHFGELTITGTYRLGERTLAAMDGTEDTEENPWFARVVATWDILGDDGEPIPVTPGSIKLVPVPIIRAISAAIFGDDGAGEAGSS